MSDQTLAGHLHIDIPQHRIPRKAVSARSLHASSSQVPDSGTPVLPPRPAWNVAAGLSDRELVSAPPSTSPSGSVCLEPPESPATPLLAPINLSLHHAASSPELRNNTLSSSDAVESSTSSQIAKAWEDAKYFAGGLIRHPTNSNKHFSVLRHSSGLVIYQGPETSVCISIFSVRPLPPDRRLWLQQKGWTGKTGWRAKELFGANGGWVDVTPSVQVTVDQLSKFDERAWQRDCDKFLKKEGLLKRHALRETCVVRIPSEADDGYFRLVLCGGGKQKNKLCSSPTFRILSLSTAPSSLKGASLSTIGLEIGVKTLTTVATHATTAAVGPLTAKAHKVVAPYISNIWERHATLAAYKDSGIHRKIGTSMKTMYQEQRELSYRNAFNKDEFIRQTLDNAPVIGSEDGPQHPFPITLMGITVSGQSSGDVYGDILPFASFKPEMSETLSMLNGFYFGWSRLDPTRIVSKRAKGNIEENFHSSWHLSIVHILPIEKAPISMTYGPPKMVSACIVHDFGNISLEGMKLNLLLMGFLRHPDPPVSLLHAEERIEQERNNTITDIAIAQASLSRPGWDVESVLSNGRFADRIQALGQNRTTQGTMSRYFEAQEAIWHQVNRIPIHRLGVRRDFDRIQEQTLPIGGHFVLR